MCDTPFDPRSSFRIAAVFVIVTSAVLAPVASIQAAEFIPLGFLPGDQFSRAAGVSDDGLIVAGTSAATSDQIDIEAFRWTEASGMVGLGFLSGDDRSRAGSRNAGDAAISGDGLTVVGHSENSGDRIENAFRFTESTGMASLGSIKGYATAASLDGTVIAGHGNMTANSNTEAFYWTEAAGIVALGSPFFANYTYANDISDNGEVIVGRASLGSDSDTFLWTEATGMSFLDVAGAQLGASVSSDGAVVTSVGFVTSDEQVEAYRWTRQTGAVGLGWLPGTDESHARGINGDGSVIVGFCGSPDLSSADVTRAFIWIDDLGLQDLQQLLTDQYGLGASLEGWNLGYPQDVSSNGQFISGIGRNPDGNIEAWLVRLTPPVPEPASTLLALVAFAPFIDILRRR